MINSLWCYDTKVGKDHAPKNITYIRFVECFIIIIQIKYFNIYKKLMCNIRKNIKIKVINKCKKY